ncbi:hypothetical protein QUF74_19675 [Candidatus Halobeggiatoa sp. HSG11]|nr:hypothetical protein [Candidatus Halobeggiatoa sp. HSG11]
MKKLLIGFENKFGKYNADIKYYKTHQEPELKEDIQTRFEELCHTETCYESLNQALKRVRKKSA